MITPMLNAYRPSTRLRSLEHIDFKLAVLVSDACMAWRHGIFTTTFSVSPIPIIAVSGRRHPRNYSDPTYTAVQCRHFVRFRWLIATSETV